MKKEFDDEKIKAAVRMMFEAIGEDVGREGIRDTPDRVARAFEEIFEGCKWSNKEIAEKNKVLFENKTKGIVVEKIQGPGLNGMCEHHLLPMFDMTVYIGYIPNGKVVGLSKLARVAELCAKRPSLQEKIGCDIAECLEEMLGVKDIAVVITARHGCIQFRGAKKDVLTKTAELRGGFMDSGELRAEFYQLIRMEGFN